MPVMKESLVRWTLNGSEQTPLLCSPGNEEDLLRGFLLTEGISARGCDVHIHMPEGTDDRFHIMTGSVSPSSCFPCESRLCLSLSSAEDLLSSLDGFPRAYGEHAVLLSDRNTQVCASDISRHHALDKAVGKALSHGLQFSECVLCLSARISLEMVRKAVRASIPVLVARKAVGRLAAEEALHSDCAIFCLASPPEVFGAAWRLTRL